MKAKICPSMMCADIFSMKNVIEYFEKAGIEYLHIDIMDGIFVPNYTLGTDFCSRIKEYTSIPLDIHLMIERPEDKIDWFPISQGDYVSIHAESTNHIQRTLQRIRDAGGKPMLALNPATPVCMLENVMDDIDAVLIMTVNPGYAGQKLIPATLEKISATRRFLDSHYHPEIEIEVDGNVSFENAQKMRNSGADMFVAGSSSVFNSDYSLEDGITKLRECIK